MNEKEDFIREGGVKIYRTSSTHEGAGPGRKGKEAFYNSSMRLNRDISVMFLKALPDNIRVLDAMGATGIRGLRYAKESGNKEIHISEITEKGVENIRRNAELNGAEVHIHHRDANLLMRELSFDFIDIDPFGSPVPFIDSAIASLKNGGILAVTATDTAPLAGTYPAVCRRRYLAEPIHTYFGHESGIRILTGFIVRMGAIRDIAFTPILSYYSDHYFRVFLRAKRGAGRANLSLERLKYFTYDETEVKWQIYPSAEQAFSHKKKVYGPVWADAMGEKGYIERMRKEKNDRISSESIELLNMLMDESDAPIFFYDTDIISSILKRSPPPRSRIFDAIPDAVRTHFSPLGFKTSLKAEEVLEVFRGL